MMKDRDDVRKASPVEPIELRSYPRELNRIRRNVRIEHDEVVMAVAKGKGRVAVEPPRRSIDGPEFGHRRRGIAEAGVPILRPNRHASHIMVTHGEEVRHLSVMNQSLDERRKADVPLLAKSPVDHRIPRLDDEANRKPGAFFRGNDRQHMVDDISMGRLHDDAVSGSARVAVGDEGESRVVCRC